MGGHNVHAQINVRTWIVVMWATLSVSTIKTLHRWRSALKQIQEYFLKISSFLLSYSWPMAIIVLGTRHQKVTLELLALVSLCRNQQKMWRPPKQPIRPPEIKRHGHQVRRRPRLIPTKSRPTVRATGRWIAQRSRRGQYQHLQKNEKNDQRRDNN